MAESMRYEIFIISARDSSHKYTPQGVNCRPFYANVRMSAQPAGRIPVPRRAHSRPYQSGRLPHTEALSRWPGKLELFTVTGAPPVPLPSRLGFCTQTSRPRFAQRSRLTQFWGPWRRRRRRRTPPRPACRAAPSSTATGCSTAAAGAVIAFASLPRARFARRCCTSSAPYLWAGTSVATRRSLWRAARCSGPACRRHVSA